MGCAVHVMKIATGEIEEAAEEPGGLRPSTCGKARAESMTPSERMELVGEGGGVPGGV